MVKVTCPDCGRDISLRELEAKTVAQTEGFDTHYRCPFCRSDVENVSEQLA